MQIASALVLVGLSILQIGCGNSSSSTADNDNSESANGQALESTVSDDDNFVTFESGQVRPLAISEDGKRVFATNTPNTACTL